MNQNDLILELVSELNKNKPKYEKLKRYYEGKHDILYKPPRTDKTRADNRIFFSYPKKTINNFTGYLLGKPVKYTSKSNDKEFVDEIDKNFSFWEKDHNIALKQSIEVYGLSYEACYINKDGEFLAAVFNPLEMTVVKDGTIEGDVKLAVRKYKLDFDNTDTEYLDVWDDEFFTTYVINGNQLKEHSKKPHYFSRCPVQEIRNDNLKKSAFEDIMPIVDAYNKIRSEASDEIEEHRNAYLVIENADLSEEDAKKMKENGTLLVPSGSKVYWATKDTNGNFVKDQLESLQEEIYIQTHQINLNEQQPSNNSSISIRLRMLELENMSSIKEAIFEKALKNRLKLFCEYLFKIKNKSFDWRDAHITINRNVPTDEVTMSAIVRDLQGIVPNEELISWLPRINNPSASIQKLEEEKDPMDLDNIGNHNHE